MSFWDRVKKNLSEQGTKLVDNAAEGAVDAGIKTVMGMFTEKERQAHQGFDKSKTQQIAGRHTKQVEYQNQGEPVSVKSTPEKRQLVGDKSEDEKRDNKLMYVGAGVAVFALFALTIYAVKK